MTTRTLFFQREVPRCLLLGLALTVLMGAEAHGQEEVKLNTQRLSERVLLTWGCDYFQGTIMGVIVTEEGLVVIDTGLSPSTVGRQRELVERELGRDDFRYLINTHMHNDHAFANEVFPEATVVAPQHSVEAVRREVELIPQLLERLRSSRESYREWLAVSSPDSTDWEYAREGVAAYEVGIADLERGISPRYPTLTFDGRHTLDLGGLDIELFDFRGFHSDSDLLILVPEERLLFTGDAFWGGQLPTLRSESPEEFHRLMENWGTILETSPELEFIVPGHSDVPLTVEEFRGMYQYLSRLWSDVQSAREEGLPPLRFLRQNQFAERYPEVADFNYIRQGVNMHQHNVYVLWQMAGG